MAKPRMGLAVLSHFRAGNQKYAFYSLVERTYKNLIVITNIAPMYKKILLSTWLFFFWGIVNAQVKVPEKIIGNWIDNNNNWEYGFFEKFAVYNSEFWEYEVIRIKNNRVEISLKNGNQREDLKLVLSRKSDGMLTISRNHGKPGRFKLNQPGFFPYTKSDHKPFKSSGFQSDTVTIIGYYRHLNLYKKMARNDQQKGPFKISVPDFILDKSVEYFADFDSLGRFEIKFPVLNTQQVYLDWGRLTHQDVVEPGESIFLYADMADYLPKENEKGRDGWAIFRSRPKEILYMGKEARLHNELANYIASSSYFNRGEIVKKSPSDMDFLVAARSNYDERLRHLEHFIKSKPMLSDRFKVYQHAYEKYQLAFNLMQYRFDKLDKKEVLFDNGYMEFVNSTMDFNDEKLLTLVREYSTFIRDYVDYYKMLATSYKDENTGRLRSKGFSVSDADVLIDMKGQGIFSKQEEATLSEYSEMVTKIYPKLQGIKDPDRVAQIMKPYQKNLKDYMAIVERLGIQESLPELRSQLLQKNMMEAELKQIDSLIQNKTLQELLIARTLYHSMDHARLPLSAVALNTLDEKIANPAIKAYILGIHNHYLNLGDKQISYLGSLKNTEHLKEAKDAESLFQQLIAPYKGKVIYIDFWGTWCGPCIEQMPFVGAVKKELAGKEVIFMYLANKSPEKSWMNVIKQMDLAGENVVHYRLPAEQQAMIERKFSVNSFPTYILIGKDGRLVKDDAPRPEMKSELIGAINKLLKE